MYCSNCRKDTAIFGTSLEMVNYGTKTHWMVQYCNRCGLVLDVEEHRFSYRNLIPRIGRFNSALFLSALASVYCILPVMVRPDLKWIIIGAVFGTTFLIGLFPLKDEVKVVDTSPYLIGQEYPELKKGYLGANR